MLLAEARKIAADQPIMGGYMADAPLTFPVAICIQLPGVKLSPSGSERGQAAGVIRP